MQPRHIGQPDSKTIGSPLDKIHIIQSDPLKEHRSMDTSGHMLSHLTKIAHAVGNLVGAVALILVNSGNSNRKTDSMSSLTHQDPALNHEWYYSQPIHKAQVNRSSSNGNSGSTGPTNQPISGYYWSWNPEQQQNLGWYPMKPSQSLPNSSPKIVTDHHEVIHVRSLLH